MTSVFIILLSILAGVFKAVADTITHHFDTSIFSKLNPKFWNPAVSGNEAKFIPFTKYKFDMWHIANSASFGSAFGAGVLMRGGHFMWNGWIAYVFLGALFIEAFNLCYNKFLLRKTKTQPEQ